MPQTNNNVPDHEHLNLFKGGGEMGALMRKYDWENHPLGNPDQWSQSLQTNIRLLLNSAFPMFIWWTDAFYMFHNDAYIPALGKKHPKALGASARDIWAEIWGQVGVIAEDILKHANSFYADNLLIHLDRKGYIEETYWTFSYSPAYNDSGEVEGIFCACNEVTKTVLGQRRLKILRDISETIHQIQTLEQACQSMCNILQDYQDDVPFSQIYLLSYKGKETTLVGQAGQLPPDISSLGINQREPLSENMLPLAEVLNTRQISVIDFPLKPDITLPENNADTLPKKAAILPIIRPGQDKVIGFFVSGISQRLEYDADYQNFHKLLAAQIATSISSVQAQEELLLHQEYLQEIFHQAPVGITILRGPNYIVDIANPGVCEIWGRKEEDVLGRPVLEALPEVADQGIKALLDGVLHTGVPYVANELPLMLERNGELKQVYLNFVYHPMRDSNGKVTGVIAVAIDISEQVNARHEIEVINKELIATNADLDNFVYSASHDLKAPISNIEGLVQALLEHLPAEALSSEIIQQLIKHIQSSIERFKNAITDLTQVAKIQREAGEDIAFIDLADVVDEVKLDFQPVINESEAQLDIAIAPDSVLQFSRKNIRSIIYNLLSNALKYRSPDRKPHIKITSKKTPEYLVLTVADNGLGMDVSDKRKIFSMFKRLHDHVEGSGIGLYIVKRIVENAGGYIEVKSNIGKGSIFEVYFKR